MKAETRVLKTLKHMSLFQTSRLTVLVIAFVRMNFILALLALIMVALDWPPPLEIMPKHIFMLFYVRAEIKIFEWWVHHLLTKVW